MMITEVEAYFAEGCGRCPRFATPDCATQLWESGLRRLRDICRAEDLQEQVKWGHPCYGHGGRNVAIIGAFRDDFRLSFFHAALMTDPHGILERQGPNTKHADMIRFTSARQVADLEPVIRSYLREAIGYAAQGQKAPRDDTEPDWPEELVDALDADPALAEAFRRLTPGRRKGYLLNLNAAKQSETRMRRITKFRDRIIAGKGVTER